MLFERPSWDGTDSDSLPYGTSQGLGASECYFHLSNGQVFRWGIDMMEVFFLAVMRLPRGLFVLD
jgi:hypothetical protein